MGFSLDAEPLDYAARVGIWLNLDRLRLVQAVSFWRAIGVAFSTEQLDIEWADAVALMAEQVDELSYLINIQRARAEQSRRMSSIADMIV